MSRASACSSNSWPKPPSDRPDSALEEHGAAGDGLRIQDTGANDLAGNVHQRHQEHDGERQGKYLAVLKELHADGELRPDAAGPHKAKQRGRTHIALPPK